MQNQDTANYLSYQLGALLISGMTTLHVFATHAPQPHAVVHGDAATHNGMEREREVHPSHGNHGVRARYATTAGA